MEAATAPILSTTELYVDYEHLRLDGNVLEHFASPRFESQGRYLLLGTTARVEGPDRHGNFELDVVDSSGVAFIAVDVPAERWSDAEAFAENLNRASSPPPLD
jgi:hypothetical protein